MKEFRKYMLWAVCATIWITSCFIAPDFIDNPFDDINSAISILVYIFACGLSAFFWLYFIGGTKWTCAIILPLFALIGATLSFYRIGYHATLTPMLIDVTLHTNPEEALGVISWQVIVWVCANLMIAGLFIWIRWRFIEVRYAWIQMICVFAIGLFYFNFNTRLHKSLCKRFPNNVPYNVQTYISRKRSIMAERIVPQYTPIAVPDSLTIVLILGEAARADHLQLNGYPRETTPLLTKRKNIVSYPHIYSEQTHTVASLPYILTRADSIHEDYQFTETSIASIFREVGFRTIWISNQDMGSTFTPYIAECDTSIFANAGKTDNVFSKWLDEDLVIVMQQMRAHSQPRELFILHSIGSHWYYNSHVPDSMYYFQPTTTNRVVTNNSIEQIVNSYDNTIRYMDYFVNLVISSLEDENAIVIYQSDHGEALGEDGEYLHANDTEAAKHPACVIWYSDKFAVANPEKIEVLSSNKGYYYRTDYVFYTILSAAGIQADGESANMNIFLPHP